MKKPFKSFRLIITVVIAAFLLSSCGGGGSSTNKHLSSLPGMTKKYNEEIEDLEQELKECTDLAEAFKLNKERKKLKKDANKAVEDYLADNPITNVPFEQKADYQFKVKKVWVERASLNYIGYKATVTITEDMRNVINLYAYIIAVDKEGNPLTRGIGVMHNATRSPFKADMEAEIIGSLEEPADLVNFEKLVFVSKDYFDKNRHKDLTKKK